MKTDRIAIQLYTLRDHTQTPGDFAATLRRVREIGFPAVELAGTGELSPAEAAAVVRDAGLTICASHESPETILNEPQLLVDRLGELGVTYAVYPWPAGVNFLEAAEVERLIAGLDASGAILKRAGITLCYHNHHLEFTRFAGSTVLDEIYARTSPEHLQAELDIHWVQAGGADPVAACRRLAGRLPLLHVKDYTVNPGGERLFAEVGSGNLDIRKILHAAMESGCHWFIVEQDTCPGDPFDSIRKSFDYLSALELH